ncbi:hypothetical protein Patl1_32937 [Pistacia atlantica]|uniref:Uncharacterized protein n=1 Tax=Pistacia atlantica TaxID=434234 RepID=A0ACC1AQP6_9ROSI|nr:hypothetical protein Patl1_32937 [Pistacia atlantica]
MADATKHLSSINGGGVKGITDLKSLFSLLKTRRSLAFAYGFMFVFVGFTVFLAFNPSSSSSSSLSFSNIFSVGSIASSSSGSSSSSSSSSYRSQFSSVFSYFFPNISSSSSPKQVHVQPQNLFNSTRSNNTTTVNHQSPNINHTQSLDFSSPQNKVLHANQTSIANKQPSTVKNTTQSSQLSNKDQNLKPNQTTLAVPPAPKAPLPSNQTTTKSSRSSSSPSPTPLVKPKPRVSNYTASPKQQGNGSSSETVVVKQGIESVMESLMNCDLFDGEWVEDHSYPLYKPGSCSFIDEQFNCVLNGRPDKLFQQFKWKPKGCTLPRLNGSHMLELLRGKRLVFVGDSLNRNMWESLVCILRNAARDPKKVFEAHGRHHFRGEASYSFIFKDYNFSVEFFVSPFLVQEWEMPEKNGSTKETLRLDLVGRSSDQYKTADIIIFNTGHWWTHEKTSKGKDYYQEGSHVYGELNVLEAFRKALTTWARWVDANVNTGKSMVFFRGYSDSHFSGGQWNSGGACDSETEPIKNVTYLKPYPPKMLVLEKVLRGMKNHVTYLNITRLTDYRKDGHPSIYRKQNLSKEERRSPLMFQDCSHWCLPGVPDAWNELFYAELLIKENKMQQHHQNQKKRYR